MRDTAIELQRGGVGYYAQSDFVHIDTGADVRFFRDVYQRDAAVVAALDAPVVD